MHVRDLIELASAIVTHASTLLNSPIQLSSQAIHAYWSHARTRHDNWMHSIQEYSRACDAPSIDRSTAWSQIKPVLEEVLASEILSRVWCAVVCHSHPGGIRDEYSPIVRSVLMSHGEARNRALNVMVYGQGGSLADAVSMNRLRRRIEKWNDVLIGGLLTQFDARQYAFDANRAQCYAEEFLSAPGDLQHNDAWQLLQSSLSSAFETGMSPIAVSGNTNRALAMSIMFALPADCFAGRRPLRALWLDKVAHAPQNAAGLVEEALLADLAPLRTAGLYRYDAPCELRAPRF